MLVTVLSVILGTVIGLAVGSFIATLVIRWPLGESALGGRSRCDGCGSPIAPADLVPVASFWRRGGTAHCCGAPIDRIHPAVELAAGAIGGVSAILPGPVALAAALFGWTLLTLAVIDLRYFRLPNVIVAVLALGGLLSAAVIPAPSLVDRLVGAVAGYAVLEATRLLYRRVRGREGLGAGDPKMFGAIGLWVGWEWLPAVLLMAALIGLGWAALLKLKGHEIDGSMRLPLGFLLAVASWPLWLWSMSLADR